MKKYMFLVLFMLTPGLSFAMSGRYKKVDSGKTFEISESNENTISESEYNQNSCGYFSDSQAESDLRFEINYAIERRCKSKKGKAITKNAVGGGFPSKETTGGEEVGECKSINGEMFCSKNCKVEENGEIFCKKPEPIKTRYFCTTYVSATIKCL